MRSGECKQAGIHRFLLCRCVRGAVCGAADVLSTVAAGLSVADQFSSAAVSIFRNSASPPNNQQEYVSWIELAATLRHTMLTAPPAGQLSALLPALHR